MSDLLPCVEVEMNVSDTQSADAAVIWLHGLGANGHDFASIVPELQLSDNCRIRFIFPHAPSIPVTINQGMVMPAWYDILAMNFERTVDTAQLEQSAASVHRLIEREIERGIDSRRIIIAGFSQGGAVAYEAALSFSQPLAGVMALSTYFATNETVKIHAENSRIPVLSMHGLVDPVVPEALGRKATTILSSKGFAPEYKTYSMEHNVCMPQIADISVWLTSRLSQE